MFISYPAILLNSLINARIWGCTFRFFDNFVIFRVSFISSFQPACLYFLFLPYFTGYTLQD